MADNEVNEFYIALGKAICEWQYIEAELFWMYRFFLRNSDSEIASAAFYSHHSFRGKTRLLKTTGKMYFESHVKDRNQHNQRRMYDCTRDLKKLILDCEKLSEKRNDLAHHMIGYDERNDAIVLAPPYPARKLKNVPAKTTQDILSICNEFTELSDLVSHFNQCLKDNLLPLWP